MHRKSQRLFMTVFPTALGWMAGAWRGEALGGLTFDQPDPQAALAALLERVRRNQEAPIEFPDDAAPQNASQTRLIQRLQAAAEGDQVDFRDVAIDENGLTPFQLRIIHYCRQIPSGKVATYGALARQAGFPGAARAVGQVMAGNRWPLVVPCHRVVGANGSLGGYSARNGLEIKRLLLQREGISLSRGREVSPRAARPRAGSSRPASVQCAERR